jgi:hypothetical protein
VMDRQPFSDVTSCARRRRGADGVRKILPQSAHERVEDERGVLKDSPPDVIGHRPNTRQRERPRRAYEEASQYPDRTQRRSSEKEKKKKRQQTHNAQGISKECE